MRRGFRDAMTWLHTWAGLVIGWVLFAIFLTGSIAVFAPEVTHWMQPEARVSAATPAQAVATAERHLRANAGGATNWSVELPNSRHPVLHVGWSKGEAEVEHELDPLTGARVSPRATEGGDFYNRVHYELHAGALGLWVVGFAGMVLVAAIVTGIIIHKRIFVDFFTFRPAAAPQRSWLDGHNVAGVMALPFLLMIAYSGIAISYDILVPAGSHVLYRNDPAGARADVVLEFERKPLGQPAPPPMLGPIHAEAERTFGAGSIAYLFAANVGDRNVVVEASRGASDRIASLGAHASYDGLTGRRLGIQQSWNGSAMFYRTLVGLHLAEFGGRLVSWLYFLSGLAGAVLVATGLILFTEKRRKRRPFVTPAEQRFQRAVEGLNVAAVAGAVLACVCLLYANRLIPAGLAERQAWEGRAFFLVWAACAAHAGLRPPIAAWREQLGAAAVLMLGVPVLNAATSNSPLWAAIPAGDWMTAGVDLTVFTAGLVFGAIALRLRRARPPHRGLPAGTSVEAAR